MRYIIFAALLVPNLAFAGVLDSLTGRNNTSNHYQRPPQHSLLGGIKCRDGSTSHAQHTSGACSHHGGVVR